MLIEVHAPNYDTENEVIVTKGRYTLLTESIMMQSEVLYSYKLIMIQYVCL